MSNTRNAPLLLNESNYTTWSFLMIAKLSKIGALDVVQGLIQKPVLVDIKKPTEEFVVYSETNRVAYIEIIEHLDTNHLAYIAQILNDDDSFDGHSVWQILKKKYAGDDYIAKDSALEKFLDLEYHGSTTEFISEIRAANHRLVTAKVGLDDLVKTSIILRKLPSEFKSFRTVVSVGCPLDSVATMLSRLEKHAAQNHLDRSSSIPSPQALLTTDDKFYMCPHCKKGFTICSHCDKAGHKESICFEKHPEQRPSKTSISSVSSKSKPVAQAHLAISSPMSHTVHGFTAEQIESERNFQAMLANPEFKKLNINAEYRL
ncbi:hypothetical protein PGT21_050115 [Puccinia graminis f. sp. tritici]|uniref:DUF4219 domain-containing protein n=1 Tax=Puccinia graminis f. sp. tritici TaxID=56615 RepID=A0A5B0ND17_PUCGR|nr:hypothetical protein PGT21_050115 [Puccinia graminis f. sp. tritici]